MAASEEGSMENGECYALQLNEQAKLGGVPTHPKEQKNTPPVAKLKKLKAENCLELN